LVYHPLVLVAHRLIGFLALGNERTVVAHEEVSLYAAQTMTLPRGFFAD
jgi:hypothetical protein